MKQRLKPGDKGRINTEVQMETYRGVVIFAAETGRTVSAAVDYLLRRGIIEYNQRETSHER